MSQQDLEFVLDGYARFNAGEKRPELWFWHEDAEYHVSRDDPDSAVHRGIDAIRGQVGSCVARLRRRRTVAIRPGPL